MAVIGLDATGLSIYGKGVSRHQYNLIKGLSRIDKQNCYYIFLNKGNIIPDLPAQENFHYVRIWIPNRIIWDQFQVPMAVAKYKLDIYHSLIDTLPVLGKVRSVLSAVEIPDYRIGLARKCMRNSLYARFSYRYNMLIFRPSLKKARVIITCSKSTKEDLIQRYNVEADKIRVLYHAPDEQFYAGVDLKVLLNTRGRYGAEAGYILHISSSDPRDNTPAVIRAFQLALKESKIPQKLVIGGDVDPIAAGLEKLITELGLINSVIFTGRLSERELVALYQAADLYVDPSLYEGFGLQVVEAMACGLPVITSDVTSLPEIVGGAGILVGPNDIDGLASAMVKVLTDPELGNTLSKKSLERARFFSWDKTAQDTLAIYDELLLGPNE